MKLTESQEFILWSLVERESKYPLDLYPAEDPTRIHACSVYVGKGSGTRLATVEKLENLGLLESFKGEHHRTVTRSTGPGPANVTGWRKTEKVTRWRLTPEGRTLGQEIFERDGS